MCSAQVISTQGSLACDESVSASPALSRRGVLRVMLGSAVAALAPTVALSPSIGVASPPALRMMPRTIGRFTASSIDQAEWRQFRARFISPEGRVIDTGNGGISHSEGQGYALLFAEWANDRPTFERLLNWTRANMSRPYDSLHAWAWNPAHAVKVRDYNTATDGELSIAWALLRAADRWNVAEWRARAVAMGRDILAVSARDAGDRLFLSPGAEGFDHGDRLTINPSYYNFPAIRALAVATNDQRWMQIESDGLWLLARARFGRYGLTADWVEVTRNSADIQPAAGRQLMFSWDAVRVPLFLSWAGETTSPALTAAVQFWNLRPGSKVPAWTDLRTGINAPYPGHAGIMAIAQLSAAAVAGAGRVSDMPTQAAAPDYYAAALALLARVAWQETIAITHSEQLLAQS